MRKVPSIKTVAGVSALCASVAGALLLLPFWHRSATVFNVRTQIDVGMAEEEVAALIGGPGEDFPNGQSVWFGGGLGEPDFGSYSKVWVNGDGSALIVSFDGKGRVVSARGGFVAPPEPWFDRILNACRAAFR